MKIAQLSPLWESVPPQLYGGTERIVSYTEAFKRELEEFHGAIVEGREPRTGGEDGLRDVALCRSIVMAHATGAPVGEPSRPGAHAA